MSQGTEKAHPVEHFHAIILDHFHEWRRQQGNQFSVIFEDGIEFSNFIAECKLKLYKQFPELDKRPKP